MNILMIDTSGPACGVAVSQNGKIVCELQLTSGKTHSQRVMPMSDRALEMYEMTIADIAHTTQQKEVAIDNLKMRGCYETTKLNSDENAAYYVFNAATGEFVKVGTNAKVMPFRAYIQLMTNAHAPAAIRVRHGSETNIETVEEIADETVNVYTVDGRLVREGAIWPQIKHGLESGIYVVNHQKIVVE